MRPRDGAAPPPPPPPPDSTRPGRLRHPFLSRDKRVAATALLLLLRGPCYSGPPHVRSRVDPARARPACAAWRADVAPALARRRPRLLASALLLHRTCPTRHGFCPWLIPTCPAPSPRFPQSALHHARPLSPRDPRRRNQLPKGRAVSCTVTASQLPLPPPLHHHHDHHAYICYYALPALLDAHHPRVGGAARSPPASRPCSPLPQAWPSQTPAEPSAGLVLARAAAARSCVDLGERLPLFGLPGQLPVAMCPRPVRWAGKGVGWMPVGLQATTAQGERPAVALTARLTVASKGPCRRQPSTLARTHSATQGVLGLAAHIWLAEEPEGFLFRLCAWEAARCTCTHEICRACGWTLAGLGHR